MNAQELELIASKINAEIEGLDAIRKKQHKAVLKAIHNGDSDEIEDAMGAHAKTDCKIWGTQESPLPHPPCNR